MSCSICEGTVSGCCLNCDPNPDNICQTCGNPECEGDHSKLSQGIKSMVQNDYDQLIDISNLVNSTIETLNDIREVREMIEVSQSDAYENEIGHSISLYLVEKKREGMSIETKREVWLNLDNRMIEAILAQLDEDERDCRETFNEIRDKVSNRGESEIVPK